MPPTPHVVILGAGFAGLELATRLAEEFGGDCQTTLVDAAPGFSFGFSKLEVLFGRASADDIWMPYAAIDRPGITFHQERVLSIDPAAKSVTTDHTTHTGDYLVIALGADYDVAATPGLAEYGNEFYSVGGAAALWPALDSFDGGRLVVGVCGAPYKCPPAPSEVALLLHDHLVERGVRERCSIAYTNPLPSPVPPSPDTSAALLAEFAARDITFLPNRRITSLVSSPARVTFEGGEDLEFDLFLGVPRHRAPDVVINSGMTVDGYIPVDSHTLATKYPGVFAVGDVATVGVPKAGVFAEGQAAVVAAAISADVRGEQNAARYGGTGSCYLEFGGGRVARVDIDWLSGPKPTGVFHEPSTQLREEKEVFGSSRAHRWFGIG